MTRIYSYTLKLSAFLLRGGAAPAFAVAGHQHEKKYKHNFIIVMYSNVHQHGNKTKKKNNTCQRITIYKYTTQYVKKNKKIKKAKKKK